MLAYVVDTNVGIAANGRNCPQANRQCRQTCIAKLRECVDILKGHRQGVIVVDQGGEIFQEYKQLNFSGQPGTGDMFFRELYQYLGSPTCAQVNIHPNFSRGYDEFPDDPELDNFDPSDRKFVAVALAHPASPVILNATDSDWAHFENILKSHGINIKQLCPDCLKNDS